MKLKCSNLVPVSIGIMTKDNIRGLIHRKVKYHTLNVGRITGTEFIDGKLNIIITINKKSINKIKKLISAPNVISAAIHQTK